MWQTRHADPSVSNECSNGCFGPDGCQVFPLFSKFKLYLYIYIYINIYIYYNFISTYDIYLNA